jgi:uncharacterized protein (DUF1697 family)
VSRQAALLRGVNVGGRKLAMSRLRAVCVAAGFTEVETLIASGNIVLGSKLNAAKLEAKLEKLIFEELGLRSEIFVRTAPALAAIVAANPFKAFAAASPNRLVVYFMRGRAGAGELQKIADTAVFGEQARQGKDCLYLTFPGGQGASKLKLPKLGTARNWNTVVKLAAMAAD